MHSFNIHPVIQSVKTCAIACRTPVNSDWLNHEPSFTPVTDRNKIFAIIQSNKPLWITCALDQSESTSHIWESSLGFDKLLYCARLNWRLYIQAVHRLSVCLCTCLSVYLSVPVPVYLFLCLSVCVPVYLSVCIHVCLSVYLPLTLIFQNFLSFTLSGSTICICWQQWWRKYPSGTEAGWHCNFFAVVLKLFVCLASCEHLVLN